MHPAHEKLLTTLLSQPTAPFREGHVIKWATDLLHQHAIPYFIDPIGNIVVGASSKTDYQRLLREPSAEPVRVFIAHMDHPGFHGVRWLAPHVLRIRWHGGSPTRLLSGAPVWLSTPDGWSGEGVLRKVTLHPKGYAIGTAEVHVPSVQIAAMRPGAKSLFGGFKFRKPVWKSGAKLYTKAADDLIGVFCIVATALEVFGKRGQKKRPPFIGLLTRAEEVGLVGTVGHFELGWLQAAQRQIVCVSLEASRTLPGALVGKGPIVRLGDRRTPFDADYSQVLTELAEQVLPKRHQRRIMDGGSCEGSAATAYGFPTIALAVPLGNYHNQGLEGGADCRGHLGPAPEFVHLDDVEGQCQLCLALMQGKLPWRNPWRNVQARLQKNFSEYQKQL
jgi:putative aminopeptidase FrvX